jgi:UDP-N-acetyl-2-amino-2-deoxyglucuronate dehydrogenase
MERIGAAIIGCGKVADTHAQALSNLEESRFIGVFDIDQDRRMNFAQKYGIHSFNSLDEMLGDPDIRMVSICTPHPNHPDLVVACSQAGVHALVEKPLAVDLKGCDRAINAAHDAGVKLGVISQRRFYEPVQRVKQAIDANKIGDPILGALVVLGWRSEAYYQSDPWRGRWNTEGGGVMINQTCHQIDLLQWFMGPIYEMFGYWDNLNHPYIEVEDTAIAVIRFKNGALGTLMVSNSQKPGLYGKIHVHGKNGATVGVQTEGGSPFISGVSEVVEPPINDLWTVPGEENLLEKWQEMDRARRQTVDVMTYYHRIQIQDFLNSILLDREPMVTGMEARKSVEIITAIYRSQRDNKPIRFPLSTEEGSKDFDGRSSH